MFRSIKFCVEERKQFTQFNLNFGAGRNNKILYKYYNKILYKYYYIFISFRHCVFFEYCPCEKGRYLGGWQARDVIKQDVSPWEGRGEQTE